MASRAGFVIKRDGVAKAYGSRLAGSSTVAYLLRGPEKATAKFTAEEELDDVDDVLGGEDGAAIIDWDDRTVIWMMANCRLPVHQRFCNRMIAQAFDGWTVRMAHEIYEISEKAGLDTSQYVTENEHDFEAWKQQLRESDLSEEEIAAEIESAEEERQTTEHDIWDPAEVPESIHSLHEFEGEGSWVTVRRADGTLQDYFGFSCLSNYLLRGEAFARALHDLPTIDGIPHELVTTDGLLIDEKDKVVWRWHVGRVPALENQYVKAWPGWTFREVPGGGWAGQVEVSGRDAGDLACPERKILGLVVAEHAPYAGSDADEPGLTGLITKARMGCLGTTVLVALAAVGVYMVSQSVGFTVVLGVLFAICLAATIAVFRKTANIIKVLDLDVSPAESNANMDRILKGLGYPSIEELKAAGEIPMQDDWDEEDD